MSRRNITIRVKTICTKYYLNWRKTGLQPNVEDVKVKIDMKEKSNRGSQKSKE